MLLIGILALVFRYDDSLSSTILFFILSAIGLGVYFFRQSLGFLIVGSLLFGLGVGKLPAWFFLNIGDPLFFGLGIGFLLIFVIQRSYEKQGHWWPLVPGFALLGFDLLMQLERLLRFLAGQWAIILVLIGAFLLYSSRKN
ncbi:hypothetical protein GF373_04645 [bacterium]|nr:hypothetical protein [bacterium]